MFGFPFEAKHDALMEMPPLHSLNQCCNQARWSCIREASEANAAQIFRQSVSLPSFVLSSPSKATSKQKLDGSLELCACFRQARQPLSGVPLQFGAANKSKTKTRYQTPTNTQPTLGMDLWGPQHRAAGEDLGPHRQVLGRTNRLWLGLQVRGARLAFQSQRHLPLNSLRGKSSRIPSKRASTLLGGQKPNPA